MADKKTYLVKPLDKGGWEVRPEGGRAASFKAAAKNDVIGKAKELAVKAKSGVKVLKKDGTAEKVFTYEQLAPKPKAVAKPAAKPMAKAAVKPAAKAAVKPVAKAAVKPVAKAAVKPVAKAAVKPVAKAAVKPAAKVAAKPMAKPAAKPAAPKAPPKKK